MARATTEPVLCQVFMEVFKNVLVMHNHLHCAAHNLNLVSNDAVSGVPEVDNFFNVFQDVYKSLGAEHKRWDILSSVTGESTVT